MGGCHSSAALDPVEVTGGAAPVFWSPEKEAEKRSLKLKEAQLKQREEIERATGHLRRPTVDRRRTASVTSAASTASIPAEAEEKTAVDCAPLPAATTAPPTPNSSAPGSPVVSPSPPARHFHSASGQSPSPVMAPSPSAPSSTTPSSTHSRRTSAPLTQRRSSRKADWDYDGLPGARPAGLPPTCAAPRRRTRRPGWTWRRSLGFTARGRWTASGRRDHAREEKEQEAEAPVKAERVEAVVAVVAQPPTLARPTSSEASAAFGVRLKSVPRVVRPVVTEEAVAS